MPVYFDDTAKTWYVKCYYNDYTGTSRQRKKRGFALKREALEWERQFLEKQQTDVTITFGAFLDLYYEDIKHRVRESTYIGKCYIIDLKIKPHFEMLPLSEITATTVRTWQNQLIAYKDKDGKPYAQTYIKTINNQLSAIMNYAVRYYGLKENPVRIAGSIGKANAEEMQFWTPEEFKTFLPAVSNKPISHTGFMLLFYSGMRIGEMLALEYGDIDFAEQKINISKTFQRIKGKDVVTPPKTPKSKRIISIPDNMVKELQAYTAQYYGIKKHDRIFPVSKSFFEHEIIRGCKNSSAKRIRLHDIRHSHASLLIELGFTPIVIADRLGHEKVETTLNTYSHLFPNKRDEVADKLNTLF